MKTKFKDLLIGTKFYCALTLADWQKIDANHAKMLHVPDEKAIAEFCPNEIVSSFNTELAKFEGMDEEFAVYSGVQL